jgi:lactoylglutathione lyase
MPASATTTPESGGRRSGGAAPSPVAGFSDTPTSVCREYGSPVIVRSMPKLIHTCYRVLNLDRSIGFYEKLGFEEIGRVPIRDEAINVFLGLPDDGPRLELTYNVGRTEPYEVGTGYGHIAITVEDMDATLERLAGLGIEPERPPYSVREGGSRLCFVRDPDDYRIELLESDS